jgi:GT2 family glycosyltransferase
MSEAASGPPRVTWLLPVKNAMPYLPEALASIEAQTYRNWEVLAWDNGSTDGSREELLRWIPGRLPGRVVTDRPSPTVGGALQQMVEECATELCARMDADDTNLPERLERQVACLLDHPDLALVGTQMIEIDEKGAIGKLVGPFATTDSRMVCQLLSLPGIPHNSVLFRRSAVLRAGNYRPVPNVEDYDLWLRLAVHHRLANLDEALIHYRIHAGSATVIAQRLGIVERLLSERFAEHAPALFGCSPEEARLLAARSHGFTIVPLLRIARHLGRRSGDGTLATLRLREFLNGARKRTGASHLGDAVSHLVLSLLDPDAGTFRREVRVLMNAVAAKLRQRISARAPVHD